ncbi:coenzyme F420-0:L-glutamate ligase [Roseibium polysiphoniae]|uniref:Coenzyme F420-0:L-glutamate ligase n=1 Tax=Roseibium polysiphoniae TaxID=2571221 RepID=A0ABR9CBZ8_9HYPH|nr:coenzyme F420-0:L-glutamate ligase [Roseibium polysiphoniae]MBD8877084.1 coenzyme F420-0:L-glutamate ligase [Roseibium polysiphoniae]
MARLTLTTLDDFPLVNPGDDLANLVAKGLKRQQVALGRGDVVVIAQKVVSKAEDRFRNLADITPGQDALDLAEETDKDPRLVQAILDESTEVVRKRKGVLVVRHRCGWVMAQAGIDQSNVEGSENGALLLLPIDPDASAARLRAALLERLDVPLGVVIADSFGRPFRNGTTGVAIGAAGVTSFMDIRGERDLYGRELKVSTVAHADELASAASLLMGQGNEGCPVVLVQGLAPSREVPAASLIRPLEDDLFR